MDSFGVLRRINLGARLNLFSALSVKSFAWLWTGQSASRLGDRLFQIALAWEVLRLTGSATAMGTVMLLASLPMLLFLLPSGVAADRWSRRGILFLSDLTRGVLLVILVMLMADDRWAIEALYGLIFLFGVADAFFQPAYTALLPQAVPESYRSSANSLTALSGRLGGIVGPLLGAVIFEVGGAILAFSLDSATFFLSALCIWAMGQTTTAVARQRSTSGLAQFKADLRDGLAYVVQHEWLWVTIGVWAIINLVMGGAVMVVLPPLVQKQLGAQIGGFGVLLTASSLGSIFVAVILGQPKYLRKRGWSAYAVTILAGVALLLIGLTSRLNVAMLGMFLLGGSMSAFSLIWINALQEFVPSEVFGRVSSLDLLGSIGFMPLGFAGAGILADAIGSGLVFVIAGGVTVGLACVGLLFPSVRALD